MSRSSLHRLHFSMTSQLLYDARYVFHFLYKFGGWEWFIILMDERNDTAPFCLGLNFGQTTTFSFGCLCLFGLFWALMIPFDINLLITCCLDPVWAITKWIWWPESVHWAVHPRGEFLSMTLHYVTCLIESWRISLISTSSIWYIMSISG